MTATAHRIQTTFRVSHGGVDFTPTLWYPVLERSNPTETIYMDPAGTEAILIDGQDTVAVRLRAYKIKRNTFIAVGGAT